MSEAPTTDEIEDAVDDIMSDIEDHEFVSGDVPARSSIQFYTAVMDRIKTNLEYLRDHEEGYADDE